MNIKCIFSVMEGVNLLVSSGTASAIAADRLCMVKRKTARKDDTKVHSVLKSPKMSHLNFELWHFRSIFVMLKVVCLVTLLDW